METDVTFSDLSNAALKAQSLYRKKGYITTRVIIPKQDFLSGDIKIAVIESYLEDIVVTGGTIGTRDYIKYMTSSVLKDNLKNKIFKFDDLERQLLLIKKNGLGKLTSTLSKGSKLGTSLLTINIDPEPLNISAFSNTDLSNNLGDYVVGLKSFLHNKNKKSFKDRNFFKICISYPGRSFEWSVISRETNCKKRLKPQYDLCILNYKNKGSFPKYHRRKHK